MSTEYTIQPDSKEMTRQLKLLQEDYTRENKSPFKRFYCPIMGRDDETAELCLGHVINQTIPNSSRARIVQRKDVDGFYGRLFERDFVSLVQVRSRPINKVLSDPDLRKKLKPKILLGGEVLDYYEDRGHTLPSHHFPLTIKTPDGWLWKIVIKKTPKEMSSDKPREFSVLVDYDRRVEALGSFIKSAYLTLFKMLGYNFALSASGLFVGYSILGGFFRQCGHMSTVAASSAALDYFRPYVNMVRPMDNYDGLSRAGTIENDLGMLCKNRNGVFMGLVINVRTDKLQTSVLMPAFDNEAALVAYLKFLENDDEQVILHHCKFAEDRKSFTAEEKAHETRWPKKDVSFDAKSGMSSCDTPGRSV